MFATMMIVLGHFFQTSQTVMLMCVYKSVRLLGNDVIYRDKERIVLVRNWHLIEEKDGDSILDTETCFMLSYNVQTEWACCVLCSLIRRAAPGPPTNNSCLLLMLRAI